VSGATFDVVRPDLVDINIMNTRDVGPLLLGASLKAFKPIFLKILVPQLNGERLNAMFNSLVIGEVAASRGEVPMNLIGILLYMIPENHIKIPEEI